ncbi:DUF3566 domain-containing protein [Nocardioides iriomotensis]|jgi:transmembrane protein DUF3566|uniref:DUF3566 domain-containing protein n=1 Tax=Nocardioides iriomotensis TaxID=715784 RepID=A0A4Q5IYW9_9ACTN|nr:DUF3566 domain-containing protein [Nocardioides iriomotensis]RYU10249.1 DUF3566 domain-containing protein [Nocardioides iriomotensis]
MADRRGDDTPLAPRRSLGTPGRSTADDESRRPLSERVSAAVSAASSAVQQAASPSGPSTRTTTPSRPGPVPGRPAASSPRPGRTRRARLRLVHLDPWSVMKTSFLLSIAFGIVTVVSVAVVWAVLGAAGVWDSINSTVTDVLGGESASTFDIQNYVGTSRVLGFTMIVAVVDVILITAIATLGAFLYNLAAALLGGLEVTLAEDDH